MNIENDLAIFSTKLSLQSSIMSVSPNICSFENINGDFNIVSIRNVFSDLNCYQFSTECTTLLFVLNLLIFLVGVTGNVLVAFLVLWKPNLRTPTNFFLFNVAVADLLVTLCSLPGIFLSNVFIPWTFGKKMCQIVPYSQAVSVTISVYSILAFSIERCLVILYPTPYQKYFTNCQSFLIITVIWIFGLGINLPWHNNFYHVITISKTGQLPFCYETWSSQQQEQLYYGSVTLLICYLVPIFGIQWCENKIAESIAAPPETSVHDSAMVCTRNRIQSQYEFDRNKKQETFYILRYLKLTFSMMWLPFYVPTIWDKFFGIPKPYNKENSTYKIVRSFVHLLGTSNSSLNPVLFAYYNKKFRERFISILTWLWLWCCARFTSNSSVPSAGGSRNASQSGSGSNPAQLRPSCPAMSESRESTATHSRLASTHMAIYLDVLKLPLPSTTNVATTQFNMEQEGSTGKKRKSGADISTTDV